MASYFNKNVRILRRKLEIVKKRPLDFLYISTISGFNTKDLQQWEKEGQANLEQLRKLADFYKKALGLEITADTLINHDLRYDDRFKDAAWKYN
jgi:hypothetical protein